MARRAPEQQAPPVQRILFRYAKRGRLRFASHRDLARAFERALRRAGVAMAYSSGYSPHPRVSYANAAPTGAASEAEYVEIGLAEVGDPEQVRQAVNQALPEGFHLEAAAVGVDKGWNDRLTHSLWRIGCPAADAGQLQAVLAEFLGRDRVCVAREVKAGLREFDVRGQVESLRVVDGGLEAVTKLGAPLVRPDDVVAALRAVQPDFLEGEQPLFTRLALGRWTGTEVVNLL